MQGRVEVASDVVGKKKEQAGIGHRNCYNFEG